MKTGFHVDPIYLNHRPPEGHPERAERMEAMLRLARRAGELGVAVLPAARRATAEELSLVHTREHVGTIAATAGRRGVVLDPDTYTSPASYDTALCAAGGILDLVDRVMAGELGNAFAAVRPPGHHAGPHRAMGFCLFNNVALGAAYALARHGLQRVMVVDWDVHHGNGTQEIFWNDARLLYVSLHQFPYYPGTGDADEVGGGDARGRCVNIPMRAGFGDAEWTAAFRRVVVPVGKAFAPQLVMISAGFDAHERDPLASMRVTEAGYAAMTDEVMAIAREHAQGRVVAALEGGYDLTALEASVEVVLRRLASDRPAPGTFADAARFDPVYDLVRAAHAPYWDL
jgi:acetoin utilization deacetylase AcuC-like enzyme